MFITHGFCRGHEVFLLTDKPQGNQGCEAYKLVLNRKDVYRLHPEVWECMQLIAWW